MMYKYFFACLEELGGAAMRRLLAIYGDEETVYKSAGENLITAKVLTEKQYETLARHRKNFNPDREYEDFVKKYPDMKLVTMGMGEYPGRLKNIPMLPYGLFYYGSLPEEDKPAIGIIGARACSSYGRDMAEYFGREMAKNGVTVISGMACGIDGISQRAAVDTGGKSYGILGSGADVCYPPGNKKLYEALKEKGGIISEYPPGTRPVNTNFPKRNRIISGLSDIVLVIESRMRSGTSITVNMALEQGRDVFAVPGRNTDELSKGCNNLIREGAGVAMNAECILDQLGVIFASKGKKWGSKDPDGIKKHTPTGLSENQVKIYEYLKDKGQQAGTEEIYSGLSGDVPVNVIMVELMEMTMKGVVKEHGGRYEVI